jgi:hypothetical protein
VNEIGRGETIDYHDDDSNSEREADEIPLRRLMTDDRSDLVLSGLPSLIHTKIIGQFQLLLYFVK